MDRSGVIVDVTFWVWAKGVMQGAGRGRSETIVLGATMPILEKSATRGETVVRAPEIRNNQKSGNGT